MHNEGYIESGILELYAAGGLSQEEREEVERRATASPEILKALNDACEAMEGYALLHAVVPRPELKDRIMHQLAASVQKKHIPEEEAPVRPLYSKTDKNSAPYKWMLAATIALFLLSSWLGLHFYNKWQQAEQKLANVIASEQQLAQNFQNTSLQLQQQEKVLSILRNPAFKSVRLQGVTTHQGSSLLVYWNASQQEVYVDAINLPMPPSGKQYQLWALKDGKPIDAGLIEELDSKTGLQQMKNISAADAFAVTLEPAGGSKEPTLEQLTVMGKI